MSAKSFLTKWILFSAVALVFAGSMTNSVLAEDQVLAKIGNETITEADFLAIANAVPEKFQQINPEAKRKAIEHLVNIFLLASEAEQQGLDKNPDINRLIQFSKKDLLASLLLEKMTKDVPTPTDAEAKAFYEKNRAQYMMPESIHLHHILVKTEKEAKDALDRVKKGEKFSEVAGQVSICPSKMRGGDLDWRPKGALVKEIEDVAYSMKKGQIEGPIKSQFGFHVLMLEDKRPQQESSFDQTKDYIVEQLKVQKQQEQYENIANTLRQKTKVEILLPAASGPAVTIPGKEQK